MSEGRSVREGSFIRALSLAGEYPAIHRHVVENGDIVDSRIGETRELLNLRLELPYPWACVIGRQGMSRAFMREEILQLLGGTCNIGRLRAITPTAAELITPATAYGPRTWVQLQAVERELRKSPTSRRAVVYIGRPEDLTEVGVKTAGEMPCTETWQFSIRDGKLHMTVTMRSWDLVWGLSYDVPSFVAVQTVLAASLGVDVGTYVHNAGSGHIYDRHYNLKTWPVYDDAGLLDISDLIKESIEETRWSALEAVRGGKIPLCNT